MVIFGQVSWAKPLSARAGEIILHTPLSWESARVGKVFLRGVYVPQDYEDLALDYIRQALAQGELRLVAADEYLDRYGRRLVDAYGADGFWLQGGLVGAGLAYVQGFPNPVPHGRDLLEVERLARSQGKGLWANPGSGVLRPETADAAEGRFALVEGVVVDVATVNNMTYLNFGPNWRTDFTVGVPSNALPRYRNAALDLATIKGHTIRVRGWVQQRNGPFITAPWPVQIEILR